MPRTRISTNEELLDAELRFYYEKEIGRKEKGIRLSQWKDIKKLLKECDLTINKDNLYFLALVKLGSHKHVHHKKIIQNLHSIYKGLLKYKEPLYGFKLWQFAKKVSEESTNFLPGDVNLYRWFSKTSMNGYKDHRIYATRDALIVLSAAVTYKPKEKKKARLPD